MTCISTKWTSSFCSTVHNADDVL